ncbi:hypothetical protein HELRODRAFT_164328 [Helobdella robusta]|uniref:Uncharacterized protein n=1 Tax=Helobdella robusta TaxID=6412 RepID=T1EV94_HELRO|nr:hypothetical protein HELRODRAFT_164328 [Helobdella robusta]ESN94476.1 hypothetical protein HELRODRAFT_164328 [Helobdella robusta]
MLGTILKSQNRQRMVSFRFGNSSNKQNRIVLRNYYDREHYTNNYEIIKPQPTVPGGHVQCWRDKLTFDTPFGLLTLHFDGTTLTKYFIAIQIKFEEVESIYVT